MVLIMEAAIKMTHLVEFEVKYRSGLSAMWMKRFAQTENWYGQVCGYLLWLKPAKKNI
jgi:hypothetical protein